MSFDGEIPQPGDPRLLVGPDYTHFWRVDSDNYKRHYYIWDGECKPLADWCAEYGIRMQAFIERLDRLKWTFADALTKPPKTRNGMKRIYAIKENLLRKNGIAYAERRSDAEEGKKKGKIPRRILAVQAEVERRLPEIAETLQPHRITPLSVEEETKVFEAFFRERRYEAWRRLQAEGNYVAFRKRAKYWRDQLKEAGYGRHVAFFLALLEFPKPKSKRVNRAGKNAPCVNQPSSRDDAESGGPSAPTA